MKISRTTYQGNPFSAGFPKVETLDFESVEELKKSLPSGGAKLLTEWLTIDDGNDRGACCWREELFQGKGFHPFDDTRKVKAGELVRVIGENGEWPINAPEDGILLARDRWIPLQLFLENLPDGNYFVIVPSGATARAEIKKPTREGEQRRLVFRVTSLDSMLPE